MELPELISEHLGEEDVRAGLALGDDDLLCLTPTRTLLYRADGLLSDERVTEYPHEVEQLALSDGRRKTKFHFEYVEDERSLTVPAGATRDALALVLEGILGAEGILDPDESVVEAFRFSELTLVVADRRVVKYVGNTVWEGEFEAFAYEDLTGVDFEQARVATEVVLHVDGHPERIKTPNDDARLVERALERALTGFFDVPSLSELQAQFRSSADDSDGTANTGADQSEETFLDDEIRPLGGHPESDAETESIDPDRDLAPEAAGGGEATDVAAASDTETVSIADAEADSTDDSLSEEGSSSAETARDSTADGVETTNQPDGLSADTAGDDLERIDEQLEELTTAVNRQNELLRKHHAAIKQLVEELQSDS